MYSDNGNGNGNSSFLTSNGIEKCVVDRFSAEMDELEQVMRAN